MTSIREVSDLLAANAAFYSVQILGEQPIQKTIRSLRFGPNGHLSVCINGPRRGKWVDFREDKRGDLIDLIQHARQCSTGEAVKIAKAILGLGMNAPLPPPPPVSSYDEKADQEKRIQIANWLWNRSGRISENAKAYLRARGLAATNSIRANTVDATTLREKMNIDTTIFNNRDLDTILFPLTLPNGSIQAVQQIFVLDAKKAPIKNPKITRGVADGAAIRFGRGARVVLCEGPETGLSIHQATGLPVAIGTGRILLSRIQLGPEVEEVLIGVDDDEPGRAAALNARQVYESQGKQVRLIYPPAMEFKKVDFNDVLNVLGCDAVRAAFLG